MKKVKNLMKSKKYWNRRICSKTGLWI